MIKPIYPWTDDQGAEHDNLIQQYSTKNVKLLQTETGTVYDKPIDVYPCRYNYEETDEPIFDPEKEIENGEQ